MSSLYLLLPVALLLGLVGLGLMIWALKNGQFEDLEGPAHRILFDDDKAMLPDEDEKSRSQVAPPPPKK
ncbi:MAG: cbb3-type cytochrome oxidase assembly protein CcoS [Magnetococcales bacterium]|nr:cbb3-type cytochrome oxidase assembly protein CcoS [Magnetococcales bacterium]NGZ26688.1 cbb3-type cytochrome oxidase assembly protein CcoS [Magnetococcales bacterium]